MSQFRSCVFAVVSLASGCVDDQPPSGAVANGATSNVPVATYSIVRKWPHDRSAWTQGLDFDGGRLFEGTGLEGQSTLREISLDDDRVLRKIDLAPTLFGEGITILGGRVFQLTWKSRRGFVYDLASFRRLDEFGYDGEGWGLTNDGTSLIMSDGTATLRFLDPRTFAVQRTVTVREDSGEVGKLNELEWVNGQVWANVWETHSVARIDPATGRVLGYVDLTGIFSETDRSRFLPPGGESSIDVLNGIAYDSTTNRLVVTGKNWPLLYEIRVDSTAR
jgi:glutamine cyclotransferase